MLSRRNALKATAAGALAQVIPSAAVPPASAAADFAALARDLAPGELPGVVDAINSLRAIRAFAGVPASMTTREAIDADLIYETRSEKIWVLCAANACNA